MSRYGLLVPLLFVLALPGLAGAQGAGVSPDGAKGYVHVVVPGDTLWDVTTIYIETPWIWPSIWDENNDIRNPHLIYPGDLIWITDKSMHKVSPGEAARYLLDSGEYGEYGEYGEDGQGVPGAPFAPSGLTGDADPSATPKEPDPFGALDEGHADVQRTIKYPGVDRLGFVSPKQIRGSGAILGSHEEHYWASQLQRTIVSLGEGEVHIGDTFTVYRTRRRVLHPTTGKLLGYFTQVLGHVEVTEIHPESSFVKVVDAYSEIEPGDRITTYKEFPTEFVERRLDEKVQGTIVAHQPYRIYSAWNDMVVLDRGSKHGVQQGNRFTIYRKGKAVRDPLTHSRVMVPDDVIGQLFVVRVSGKTSLALITRSHRKVREGDRFKNL